MPKVNEHLWYPFSEVMGVTTSKVFGVKKSGMFPATAGKIPVSNQFDTVHQNDAQGMDAM